MEISHVLLFLSILSLILPMLFGLFYPEHILPEFFWTRTMINGMFFGAIVGTMIGVVFLVAAEIMDDIHPLIAFFSSFLLALILCGISAAILLRDKRILLFIVISIVILASMIATFFNIPILMM